MLIFCLSRMTLRTLFFIHFVNPVVYGVLQLGKILFKIVCTKGFRMRENLNESSFPDLKKKKIDTIFQVTVIHYEIIILIKEQSEFAKTAEIKFKIYATSRFWLNNHYQVS